MKKAYFILITCFCLQLAHAQSKWVGGWQTQHGHVELITSKGYIYGLYANVGWVYGKVAPGGNRVVGTFWNEEQKKTGRFEWNLNASGRAFTGKWAWGEDFKTLEQLNGGNWNGSKSNTRKTGKPWTKTYTTNAGELQIIHMGEKRALGILNEVVFSGHANNASTFIGVMHTLDVLGRRKQYGTSFSINQTNNTLSGYWFKPSGRENLTGTLKGNSSTNTSTASTNPSPSQQQEYKIRITFNTFKLNKARRGNTQKGRFDYQVKPLYNINTYSKVNWKNSRYTQEFKSMDSYNEVYHKMELPTFGDKEFKVGVEEKISTWYEFKIEMSLEEMKTHSLKFVNIIDLNIIALRKNIQSAWQVRDINIVEILQYLTKQVNASDFPNAVHGRKRLSNSDDTFWLEEYAGKRKARGYGDLIFENDVRFGYSYTIELID